MLVLISKGISGSNRVSHLDSKRVRKGGLAKGKRLFLRHALLSGLLPEGAVLTLSPHVSQGNQGVAPYSGDSNMCQVGTSAQQRAGLREQ